MYTHSLEVDGTKTAEFTIVKIAGVQSRSHYELGSLDVMLSSDSRAKARWSTNHM